MLVVIAAVFLGMGLWELRWQRRLVELGNKLNNQAFQTLRGLPEAAGRRGGELRVRGLGAGVRPQP